MAQKARQMITIYVLICKTVDVQVELCQSGSDEVRVSGARGSEAPWELKVTGTYVAGFRATAVCPVVGVDAAEKGLATGRAILRRVRGLLEEAGLGDLSGVHLQALGANASYGAQGTRAEGVREAVLWLAVSHNRKEALELFAREVAPAGTGMAPGLTNIVGGRPRVAPILRHEALHIAREDVKVTVTLDGNAIATLNSTLTPSKTVCSYSLIYCVNDETEKVMAYQIQRTG